MVCENSFDKVILLWHGGGTRTRSVFSPRQRDFFVSPTRETFSPIWWVEKAECNTRKGNKPRRLLAMVETRHLIKMVEILKPEGDTTMSKNNSVVAFNFQSKEIRTSVKEDNSVWFAAKDVAAALDIKWSWHTLGSIPKSWQSMVSFTTNEGKRELTVISEPAVYKLAFRSNKPEAEAFTNWVAGEVLPAIRKTGKYELSTLTPEQQRKIQIAIAEKVYDTRKKNLYPAFFKNIYRLIKDKYQVAKYDQVPAVRFDELMEFIGSVNILEKETDHDNRLLHCYDIGKMLTAIARHIDKINEELVEIQTAKSRIGQACCLLIPEMDDMKVQQRINELKAIWEKEQKKESASKELAKVAGGRS